MATKGSRDVKLTVDAQATGAADIQRLATTIRELGKAGGEVAPEFEKLASEIEQLGSQARAVEAVKQLTAEVTTLATAQENAATKASGVKTSYGEAAAAAKNLRAEVFGLQAEYNASRDALAGANEALSKHRAEIGSVSKASESELATLRTLRLAVAEARGERDRLNTSLQQAKRDLSEAEKAESKLATQHERTATAEAKANTALQQRTVALQQARNAAAEAGVEINDLAAAEERMRSGVLATVAAAQQLQAALTEQAEADRLLAIEERTLADLRQRAAAQLIAEITGYSEATQAAQRLAEAERAASATKREQAEADRLAAIEALALAEQRQKGLAALEAERAALRDAAASVAAYDAKLAEARAAEEAFAQASRDAKAALEGAFSTVGVRSLQTIQNEINQTREAVTYLERQFSSGAISAQDLARAVGASEARMQALRTELASMPAAAGVFERMNASVLDLINRFGALSAALATVGFAVKPMFDATIQLESMQRILTQVYGSLAEAQKQIAFVNEVSRQAGIDVLKAGDAYTKFAASAKASGIETSIINEVFKQTASAAGNLGLSSEKVTSILLALSQMANKGVVSMEELRQQLGEALPGALSLLAKGLGITEPQLVKMVESGQLLTRQVLGPLAQAMTELGSKGKDVQGLQAEFNRLKNAVTAAYQSVSETTAYKALTALVGGLASNFGALTTATTLLGEALLTKKIIESAANFVSLRTATTEVKVATDAATTATAANTVATTANTTATAANTTARLANIGALSQLGAGLATIAPSVRAAETAVASAAASTGLFTRALGALGGAARGALALVGGLPGVAAAVLLNAKELGTSIGELAAKWAGWGKALSDNEKKFEAQNAALKKQAEAQKVVGASWVQLTAQYNDATGSLEKNIHAAEKHAEAAKIQGDSLERIARLSGDERQALDATFKAANLNAQALRDVSAAQEVRTQKLRDYVAALQAQAEKQGTLTDAERKYLADLQDKLKVQEAVNEQAKQAADLARSNAEAALAAANSYGDQSKSLDVLKQEFEDARSNAEQMQIQFGRGLVTIEQLNAANERAALAQGRFRDAVSDTVKNLDFEINAIERNAARKQNGIDKNIEYAKSSEVVARSLNDERGVVEAQIAQKDLQIDKIRQAVDARLAEAAKIDEGTKLIEDEANRTNTMTREKREEIEVRKAAAQQLRDEAATRRESVRGIEAEIDALKRRNAAQAGSFSDSLDQYNKTVKAKTSSPTYDKDGFATDANGNRITASTQLQPPDASGDWEFVPDQSVTSSAHGPYYVPKVGYWRRKSGDSGIGNLTGTPGGGGGGLGGGGSNPFGSIGGVNPNQSSTSPTSSSPTDPYSVLGLSSPTASGSAAKAASDAMRQIMASSVDIGVKQQAYVKYAQAVLAANGGSPTSEMIQWGQQLGLQVYTEAGQIKFKTVGIGDVFIQQQDPANNGQAIPNIPTGSSTPAPTATPQSTSHTVTINLGGKSTTINAATAGDAAALTDLLQQLGDTAARS